MKEKSLTNKQVLITSILFFIIVVVCIAIGVSCGRKEEKEESTTVVDKVAVATPTQEETTIIIETEKETLKDVDVIVQEVLNGDWGVGQDRINRLTDAGYDFTLIQDKVDELMPEPIYYEEIYYEEGYNYNYSDGNVLNPYIGVVYYNGHKETYYSQRVLPGGGLNIPGRHVAWDGTIRDENDYICVAADPAFLPYGSLVETSLGMGKVYDCGCAYGTVDIYTDW